jgi:DNA-directed RNA polymerase subunit RPC12/RpoP
LKNGGNMNESLDYCPKCKAGGNYNGYRVKWRHDYKPAYSSILTVSCLYCGPLFNYDTEKRRILYIIPGTVKCSKCGREVFNTTHSSDTYMCTYCRIIDHSEKFQENQEGIKHMYNELLEVANVIR